MKKSAIVMLLAGSLLLAGCSGPEETASATATPTPAAPPPLTEAQLKELEVQRDIEISRKIKNAEERESAKTQAATATPAP